MKWNTFFPRIQVKTKKKIFTRNGTLFSPNSGTDLRSDAHQSQIIGGDAGEDHTQIVGGIQSNYWGDIYPPSPPDFGTPAWQKAPTLQNKRSRVSCFENQVFVRNVMSDVNVA